MNETLFGGYFRSKRVLLTGHTGFKGSWLGKWLLHLGAQVFGYALEPPTHPNLFEVLRLSGLLKDNRGDVRDEERFKQVVDEARPDIVFHLAAQPIVRESYRDPVGTFEVNAVGTIRLLELIRKAGHPCVIVIITSDKCYWNANEGHPFKEVDRLGGNDPYGVSKACCELIVDGWRSAFDYYRKGRVATARAGNVVGGGDWGNDRLVPDCIRAFAGGQPVSLRNPDYIRPWQHVLEPLSGYLSLAWRLGQPDGDGFCSAWNFGPEYTNEVSVSMMANMIVRCWGRGVVEREANSEAEHESVRLCLDSNKAISRLGWKPVWSLSETVQETVEWYREWSKGDQDCGQLCHQQIDRYCRRAAELNVSWV